MSSAPGIALEYRIYRNADAEPVTALLADVFPRHDPLALAAGVSSGDFAAFVRTLLPQADHDGLTIVACVPATGEIVGVMLTHDAAAYVPLELSDLSEKFEPMRAFSANSTRSVMPVASRNRAKRSTSISSASPIASRGTASASNWSNGGERPSPRLPNRLCRSH